MVDRTLDADRSDRQWLRVVKRRMILLIECLQNCETMQRALKEQDTQKIQNILNCMNYWCQGYREIAYFREDGIMIEVMMMSGVKN